MVRSRARWMPSAVRSLVNFSATIAVMPASSSARPAARRRGRGAPAAGSRGPGAAGFFDDERRQHGCCLGHHEKMSVPMLRRALRLGALLRRTAPACAGGTAVRLVRALQEFRFFVRVVAATRRRPGRRCGGSPGTVRAASAVPAVFAGLAPVRSPAARCRCRTWSGPSCSGPLALISPATSRISRGASDHRMAKVVAP